MAKAKLQARIDAANAKLNAMQERAKAAADAARQETDAKIKSLQDHLAKAHGAVKARLEARMAQVRSESKQRIEKLQRAWERIKQALVA